MNFRMSFDGGNGLKHCIGRNLIPATSLPTTTTTIGLKDVELIEDSVGCDDANKVSVWRLSLSLLGCGSLLKHRFHRKEHNVMRF